MNGQSLGELVATIAVKNDKAKQALNDVSNGSTKAETGLKKVDTQAGKTEKSMKSLSDFTERDLKKSFNGMLTIGALIGTSIGASLYTLAQKSEDGKKSVDALKNSLGVLGQSLSSTLTPLFTEAVNAIRPMILTVAAVVKGNQSLIQGFVKTAFTIGTIMVVVGTLGKLMLELVDVGKFVAAVFVTIGASASLAMIPVIALAGVVAYFVGKQISDNISKATSSFDNFKVSGVDSLKATSDAAATAAENIKNVKDQIQEENDTYTKQLNDIIQKNKDEIASNKKTLAQEEKDYKDKQAEMSKSYAESTKTQQEQNEQRMRDLEASLNATLVVGSSTYDKDVQNYTDSLAQEKIENQKKMDNLATTYASDTATAASEYENKTSELKKSIAADEKLLQDHAAEVISINKYVADDEITTLEKTHAKRLAELEKELNKEVKASKTAADQTTADWNNALANIKPIELGGLFTIDWSTVGAQLKDVGKGILASIAAGLVAVVGGLGSMLNDAVASIPVIGPIIAKALDFEGSKTKTSDILASIGKWGGLGTGYAGGTRYAQGGLTMVGENGPELVSLPTGSKVYNNSETTSMTNSPTINNVNYFNYTEDLNVFNAKLAYQLKRI